MAEQVKVRYEVTLIGDPEVKIYGSRLLEITRGVFLWEGGTTTLPSLDHRKEVSFTFIPAAQVRLLQRVIYSVQDEDNA